MMPPMDSTTQTRRRKLACQVRLRPQVQLELVRRNLSQNHLARACGISSGYMSQLLTGDRCPGPEVRAKLQKALPKMTFDQLFEVNQ